MTAPELPALWGVMMQLRMLHKAVAVGERLGVGDVEGRSGDDVALEGVDEGVGVDVAPARHVHEPGPLVHERRARRRR